MCIMNRIEDQAQFMKYGKYKGWSLCKKFHLPAIDRVFVINHSISENDVTLRKILGKEPLLCRPDAPVGHGNNLIRGRDVRFDELNSFYNEVKQCNNEGVILVSRHPSTIVAGHYIPRYLTNGAIMVIFEKNHQIVIEYVGPGFDVGDISRGKTVHSSIKIPWELVYEKSSHIFWYAKQIFNGFSQITAEEYSVSRKRRIEELRYSLGENAAIIEYSIPRDVPVLSYDLFKKTIDECVNKILFSPYTLPTQPFGAMMNLYENKLCVFELWNIERSQINLT